MKRWLVKGVSVSVLVAVAAAFVVGGVLAAPEEQEGPPGRHGRGHGLIQKMSEATGLPTEAIIGQLQSGHTPSEILSQHGVDPDVFVADVLADLEARLDEAVAQNQIEEARADEILANAETRLNAAMDQTFDPGNRPPRDDRPGRAGLNIVRRILEATGLTPEEFREAIASGETPADILTDNGIVVDDFVADVIADLQAHLDEAVTNGLMDRSRADQIIEMASEKLPEVLNSTYQPRDGGPGNRPNVPPGQRPGGPPGQSTTL